MFEILFIYGNFGRFKYYFIEELYLKCDKVRDFRSFWMMFKKVFDYLYLWMNYLIIGCKLRLYLLLGF